MAHIIEITVGCNADAVGGGIQYCDNCPAHDSDEYACWIGTEGVKLITEKECSHIGVCIDGRHNGGCKDCHVWG